MSKLRSFRSRPLQKVRAALFLVLLFPTVLLAQSAKPPACSPPSGVFGSLQKTAVSMEGKLLFLPKPPDNIWLVKLKDFESLPSSGSVYAEKWDIPARSFTDGFPGVTNRYEWFAIDYQGSIYVPKNGTYAFRLVSDDGSKLTLDGKVVVDNDGVHGMSGNSGKVALSRGSHSFRLQYFQGPPVSIGLQLFVTEPGQKEKIFELRDFDQKVLESRENLRVSEDKDAISIRLASQLLFDTGKSDLRPDATKSLQDLATLLRGQPGLPVVIEGHTDNVGQSEANQALSEHRAASVRDWLLFQGQLPGGCISTHGYGASRPLASNATPAGRQQNRRVEIRILKSPQ